VTPPNGADMVLQQFGGTYVLHIVGKVSIAMTLVASN
jgi:hypothetical protein